MLKNLALFVYVLFISFSAFCMDGEYVRYEEGITRSNLQPFVAQLKENPLGLVLLKKIDELYAKANSRCSGIIFKRGPQTSFSSRLVEDGKKIELIIEVANFDDQFYPCLHDTEEAELKAISAESTPFWITLAHELIHLKHKLEEVNNVSGEGLQSIPYSVAKEIGIEDILIGKRRDLFPLVPELSEWRLNMSELWPNLEERRTVVGPDIDGICEASIRLSAGIPTRFIYQDKLIKSLEKTVIINQSLNKTSMSIASQVSTIDVFCISDSIVSQLTPIDILLLKGISEKQIIENADNVPITFVTKKVFAEALKDNCVIAVNSSMRELLGKILEHKPKPFVIDEW